MSDNVPDFENMSAEDLTEWLETLARRQGATEGLTTSAAFEIPEIDPSTVQIDEPGYVPYSEGEGRTGSSAVPMKPVAPPPPVKLPDVEPVFSESAQAGSPSEAPEAGSLAWLESLAAGQNESLFNLDLSALEASTVSEEAVVRDEPATSPESWLQNLARSAAQVDSPADGDTLEWLESLAVRQGASREDIITTAALDVPVPEEPVEPPAYSPFSFESAASARAAAPAGGGMGADPEDFLKSLSADSGYSETGVSATQRQSDDSEVLDAISRGEVTPDQITGFFERQMQRGLETPEPEPEDDAAEMAEDEIQPAELPDWLVAEIGTAPSAPPEADDRPSLESILPALDEVAMSASDDETPDWLRDVPSSQEDIDFGDILGEPAAEEPILITSEVTAGDTWAEAFDLEHREGQGNIDNPPAWYEHNLSDSQRIAAVSRLERGEIVGAIELSDEPLPEEPLLPSGLPEQVPAWLTLPDAEASHVAAATEPANEVLETEAVAMADDDMPDWLRASVDQPSADAEPSWWQGDPSVETLVSPVARTEPEPAPVPVQMVDRRVSTALPRRTAFSGVPSLEHARDVQKRGAIAESLLEYEALILQQTNLDETVSDLQSLASLHRDNPTVHRLLGDGLVRQGKLQQALDTYREALNKL